MAKAYYADRAISLILLGLIILGVATNETFRHSTAQKDLVPIKGVVRSCETFVSTIKHDLRHGLESSSNRATLILRLYEWKKQFRLDEHIGAETRSESFENLRKALLHTDSVTIWIKKSEANEYSPAVFKIETPRNELLALEETRSAGRLVTLFLFGLGFCCVGVSIWYLLKGDAQF